MNALPQQRELELTYIDDIEIREGRRALNEDAVQNLIASMSKIGLKTPISVRYYEERPSFLPPIENAADSIVLLAGRHRLEAAKRLGWEKIETFIYSDGDEIDAELWEIAENLHRAELTALERDEQVARWVEIIEDERKKAEAVQSEQPDKRYQERGQANASRELGISRPDVNRAVKVASLSPDAKQAAREAGLADNRTVLLNAAKEKTSEAQVHYLHTESKRREEARKTLPSDKEIIEKQFTKIVTAWDSSCPKARQKFREYIGDRSVDGRITA